MRSSTAVTSGSSPPSSAAEEAGLQGAGLVARDPAASPLRQPVNKPAPATTLVANKTARRLLNGSIGTILRLQAKHLLHLRKRELRSVVVGILVAGSKGTRELDLATVGNARRRPGRSLRLRLKRRTGLERPRYRNGFQNLGAIFAGPGKDHRCRGFRGSWTSVFDHAGDLHGAKHGRRRHLLHADVLHGEIERRL